VSGSERVKLREQIDARAAQLGRDRTSYLVWLAMKDLGLLPDETLTPQAIHAILEVLEQRDQRQKRPRPGGKIAGKN
jgi:hypothetical protein